MFVAPLEKKDLKINNGSLANREKIRTLNFAQLVRFSILKAGLLTQPKDFPSLYALVIMGFFLLC